MSADGEMRAAGHPIRVAILDELGHRGTASPSELAKSLERPVGTVGYHVRKLVDLGFVELVKKVQRRGAVAHVYRLRAVHDRSGDEGDPVRSWLRPGGETRPVQVVLDTVAMGDLRVSIQSLYAHMRQLEAATMARTRVEGLGSAFVVEVRCDVEPMAGRTRGAQGAP